MSQPPPLALSAIPTLSTLYKTSRLEPSTTTRPQRPPSSQLNSKISLIISSITSLATTSIVNAANQTLLGGGGVDGAIHAAAGPSLLSECAALNGCDTGSAKITSAHDLPCKYIIHAVGPQYYRSRKKREGLQTELLAGCYRKSLELALEYPPKHGGSAEGGSIAFSCLSTGVYGYPSGEAAEVACGVVRTFLEEMEIEKEKEGKGAGAGGLERVVFCCFLEKDVRAYEEWLPIFFPPTHEEFPPSAPNSSRKSETKTEPSPTTPPAAAEPENAEDWTTIEKPDPSASFTEASHEPSTEMSDEGEKIEGAEVSGSDGEKVEVPLPATNTAGDASSKKNNPVNALRKDW